MHIAIRFPAARLSGLWVEGDASDMIHQTGQLGEGTANRLRRLLQATSQDGGAVEILRGGDFIAICAKSDQLRTAFPYPCLWGDAARAGQEVSSILVGEPWCKQREQLHGYPINR